jgi:hypothetical protein
LASAPAFIISVFVTLIGGIITFICKTNTNAAKCNQYVEISSLIGGGAFCLINAIVLIVYYVLKLKKN